MTETRAAHFDGLTSGKECARATQSTELGFSGAGVGQFSTMGDAQTRITFDFAGSREVHYITAVPKVGDFVSHRRELWIVRKVEQDVVGLLITCELPLPVSVGSGV